MVIPLALACAAGNSGAQERSTVRTDLPEKWMQRWQNPPAEDRPLQIIHGIDPNGRTPAGMAQLVKVASDDEVAREGMRMYQERGLGGVVCNVMFQDYLRSEPSWKALVAGVKACRKLGLVVWIYDEKGYPSGSAGGLVLRDHPEYEAVELTYDPSQADPFIVRPAYEHTHASNNYHAARRYINLIDDRAVQSFIEKTHEAYKARLGGDLHGLVQAFFTDEPSLITVNLGPIPESARKNVPVEDPIDPTVKALPAVPWSYDIAERYKERYGQDLLAVRKSLFAGDTPADRKVREQYWALIADLISDRYFGALERWCADAGVASSGHTLWEEALMHHPTLEGNALQALSRMHIPGMDMLSSNPEAVFGGGWVTAGLPSSAASLNGRRRVMTEISDFSETMGGQPLASVEEMQAAAAWQAAWGVTDFTLYYTIAGRSVADYRAYCDYVGRLNAILKPAKLAPDALLYYPVHDLWAEYRPVAEPINLGAQSPRAQAIVGSFMRLGQTLTRSQTPFLLADHEMLAKATVTADGKLDIHGHRFGTLVLPEGCELPPAAAKVTARLREKGGRVLTDGPGAARLDAAMLAEGIRPANRLEPASGSVVLGRFERDGRTILLALNAGQAPYSGQVSVVGSGAWTLLDPATGETGPAESAGAGRLALSLKPRQALLLVSQPEK